MGLGLWQRRVQGGRWFWSSGPAGYGGYKPWPVYRLQGSVGFCLTLRTPLNLMCERGFFRVQGLGSESSDPPCILNKAP